MKRLLYSLPLAATALLPLSAAADVSPSPSPSSLQVLSPSLDKVLQAPPSGYGLLAPSGGDLRNGRFTAHEFAKTYGVKSIEAERLLLEDGFVDGYQLTWANQSTVHVVSEVVMAFKGGSGAAKWFGYDKTYESSQPAYLHADTTTGISQYFGVHEMQTSVAGQAYLDAFIFVKGNDVFGIGFASPRDDNLELAKNQTRSQYASAPDSTIPPSEWPENNVPAASGVAAANGSSNFARLATAVIVGIAAIVAIAAVVFILTRRRRPAAAAAAAAPPVAAAAVAPTMPLAAMPANAPPPAALQMSPDGRYWYDGQGWRDSAVEVPPSAPRTPDGSMWFDGAYWRPVPPTAMPQGSGR